MIEKGLCCSKDKQSQTASLLTHPVGTGIGHILIRYEEWIQKFEAHLLTNYLGQILQALLDRILGHIPPGKHSSSLHLRLDPHFLKQKLFTWTVWHKLPGPRHWQAGSHPTKNSERSTMLINHWLTAPWILHNLVPLFFKNISQVVWHLSEIKKTSEVLRGEDCCCLYWCWLETQPCNLLNKDVKLAQVIREANQLVKGPNLYKGKVVIIFGN